MVTLKVVESENPALQGRTFTLEGAEVDLGRSRDCGVVLDDMTVSRRHAKFVSSGGGWSVVDAGSGNGTWVNGQKVPETPLKNGDKVRVGRIVVQIEGLADVDGTMLLNEPDERTAALGPNVMPPMQPRPSAPAPPAYSVPPPRPSVQPPFPEAEPSAAAPAPFPPARPSAPPPPQPLPTPRAVAPAFPSPVARVAPQAPPFPPPAPRPAPPAPSPIPDVAAHQRGAVGAAARPFPGRPAALAGAVHGTPAGFWPRFGAYMLDSILLLLLIGIVVVPLVFLSGALNDSSKVPGVFLLAQGLAMAISLGYTLYFWSTSGATPGKRVLGLRIVREDGIEPLGIKTAVVRLLGYVVSGMIFNIGFLMIAFDKDKKGLHDKIAKTRVIKPD